MEFTAKYCNHCDQIMSKDKYHCSVCLSKDLGDRELSGKGEIYSYTNIYAAPKQFADQAPYFIVLVDLDEGLRVTARFSGDKVEIGDKVELDQIGSRAYYFKSVAS